MKKNLIYLETFLYTPIGFILTFIPLTYLMGLITINLFSSSIFNAEMYEAFKQEPLFIKIWFYLGVGIIGDVLGFLFFLIIAFSIKIFKAEIKENLKNQKGDNNT